MVRYKESKRMKTKTKWPHQVVTTSMVGGERKYRIKQDSLSKLEGSYTNLTSGKSNTYTQFEKHMIQEGIKQVLFTQGSEEVEVRYPVEVGVEGHKSIEYNVLFQKVVPKEVIQFLLDYDMIEVYEYK